MKYSLVLIALAAAVLVANDDGQGPSVAPVVPFTEGSDAITLTLLNDWVLAEKALGLDIVHQSSYYLIGADNNNDILQAYDPATCTPQGFLELDPGNENCFGFAWNGDPVDDAYYANDWNVGNLFYTEDFGITWTTSPNPAGTLGRGMAFDGTDYWQTDRDGGSVWRFQPGVGEQEIAVPEVNGSLSGIAVYPEGGDLGVVVAGYNDPLLHFYVWDGATMSYLGSASYPVGALASSFGLAYYEVDGSMFWSYLDSSNDYHIAQFDFDTSALEQETWGAIKSTF